MPSDFTRERYFNWMVEKVSKERRVNRLSYNYLLEYLAQKPFTYSLSRDSNRASDGIDLRYRFAVEEDHPEIEEYLHGPCSILEMMVALAIRCEETIMDDPMIGDRTGQWFWYMISSLGLGGMHDEEFDIWFVDDVVTRFLNRDYEPDGRGGLFFIEGCDRDLRTVEIWYQLCWYLDNIA